jgi:hypothetical protein
LGERPLHQWLPELNDGLVLITTPRAIEGVSPEVLGLYLDVRTVADYQSWATEYAADAAARQHGVDLIVSSSEDDVLRCARLRERLGLPGQDLRSALAYRDKLVMVTAAAAAGLAVPRSMAVACPGDLLDFVADVGLPVVVKPRRESASIGVAILRSREDLTAFLASGAMPAVGGRPESWLAQEFIDAPFCHVDGIVAGNEVLHCWPSRYSGGSAESLACASVVSSTLLAAADPATEVLIDFAAAVHRALPGCVFPMSFHLEAWLHAERGPVLCEVASRTGGVRIADTYLRAFGPHLSRQNLRGQAGLPIGPDPMPGGPDRPRGWIMFPRGRGRFSPPGPCPVPGVQIELDLAPGEMSDGMTEFGDSAATALAAADTNRDLDDRIAEATGWWSRECQWT